MSGTLILLRHGQSIWNQQHIFTGWCDVALTPFGEEEALKAKEALKDFKIDAVFVSALKRAQDTATIVLGDRHPKTFVSSKALNERKYGALEGKSKEEIKRIYGEEQVQRWRRSYEERPPEGESLKDTCDRVLPFFKAEIEPRLKEGQTVLIAAHGNSLRALMKYLEGLSDEEIVGVEIPTAIPIVYRLGRDGKIMDKTVL